MIRAVGDGPKGKVAIFGLSEKNLEKLREGKPIHFSMDELGMPGWSVAILYGETEDKIVESFKELGVDVRNAEDRRPKR